MIAALARTEFLPTDTGFSMPDSPFLLWGAVILGSVAFAYLMDEEWIAGAIAGVIALVMATIPCVIQFNENQETNQTNRIQNVKTAYDVDDILLETWSESNPKAIVTKDSKSYEVILSENKETFEPILSTLNNDSLDVEKWKRAK